MRILLLEYVTGGGLLPGDLPQSLLAEGSLMIEALASDFLEIADAHATILRDCRLPIPKAWRHDPRLEVIRIDTPDAFETNWRLQIDRCDAVWPIAPESGGTLERLSRDVEVSGRLLLGCPSAAIRLAASKSATAQRLAARGVAVANTASLRAGETPENFPVVVKPDDGAGCDGIRIIRNSEDWRAWLEASTATETAIRNPVVQALVDGIPSSLSVLFSHGTALLLSGNRQVIRRSGGRFALESCRVNAVFASDHDLQGVADAVSRALPELWGYAGIDFVETSQGPVILEINPRLTTSYAGLRAARGFNAARMVLELKTLDRLPSIPAARGSMVEVPAECRT
jgi:tyramine---L-glutamate ligase